MRSASKRKLGGSCHRNGPSLPPRRSTPDAKKFARAVDASRSRRTWVTYRPPFTVKTKSSGVSSRHWSKCSGRCSE